MTRIKEIYEEFQNENPRLKELPLWDCLRILLECYRSGGKILICGNGGSAADSEHIVGELMKGFRLKRPLSGEEKSVFSCVEGGDKLSDSLQKGIPAISLNSHTALMTAVGNDIAFDMVFAQQVYAYGEKNDVLIAMSTSGNSADVIEGAKTAKVKNMKVIGITGRKDSKLAGYSDLCLHMPAEETYRIQEYTLPLYHALCAMLEECIFGGDAVNENGWKGCERL